MVPQFGQWEGDRLEGREADLLIVAKCRGEAPSPGVGSACALTVAANSCHACTRSVARTLTAVAGRVVTANWTTASRPPRGLPSQRVAQVASVVFAPLSPSCVTMVAVVSAVAGIDRSSAASSGMVVATMPATTVAPATPRTTALRRGPGCRVRRCSPCRAKVNSLCVGR